MSLVEHDGYRLQLWATQGSVMETRLITFAGNSLAILYSGGRPARIVDFLYRYAPADGDVPPHLTYRLTSGEESGQVLYRGDTLLYEGDSEATLAELLLGDTCRHLTAGSRGGLMFHAAGLVWGGKGILLPGAVGAGKTTLAAWLATKGLDYLTDELVFVRQGADVMQAFTRPLKLKSSARVVLQDRFDFEGNAGSILEGRRFFLVPPALLKPTNTLSEPPLSLIIFPSYQPGSRFKLRHLSQAQAGLALMQCLVNARNLPEHGFPEVVRLAKTAPAYQMSYSNFDQLDGYLETLLQSL